MHCYACTCIFHNIYYCETFLGKIVSAFRSSLVKLKQNAFTLLQSARMQKTQKKINVEVEASNRIFFPLKFFENQKTAKLGIFTMAFVKKN